MRFTAAFRDLPQSPQSRNPACVAENLEYTAFAVKRPLVNLEEDVAKVVGRRLKLPDPLSVRMSRKQDAVAWRRAFGGVKVPRGVYRFHTHQEADAWLWQMICRPSRS